MGDILSGAGPDVVPFAERVLTSNDPEWKYGTIELLLARVDMAVLIALRDLLLGLATNPEISDKEADVDAAARDVLKARFGISK